MRLARTEGRLTCLNIIDECTGEAVEEAAKGCIREVSDFVAGEPQKTFSLLARIQVVGFDDPSRIRRPDLRQVLCSTVEPERGYPFFSWVLSDGRSVHVMGGGSFVLFDSI